MMLEKLIHTLKKLITPQTRTEQLDAYLASKEPKTVQDVEFYVRQFDKENSSSRMWSK